MSAFLPLARVEASRRRRGRGDARDGGLLRYPAASNNAPVSFLWARPGRATCDFLILATRALTRVSPNTTAISAGMEPVAAGGSLALASLHLARRDSVPT